jgi:quercetin dioxygenase-like cupin family protein
MPAAATRARAAAFARLHGGTRTMKQHSMRLPAATAPTPFAIPGATGGTFRIQILNEDQGRGVVTSIVHIPAGGRIPAHCHRAGSEMHFLLAGDLVDDGEELAPGAFLTHAPGAVHGPHESRGGAQVLTVQSWQSHEGDFDFEPADEPNEATPNAGVAEPAPEGAPEGGQPVDQQAQIEAREEAAGPDRKGYA